MPEWSLASPPRLSTPQTVGESQTVVAGQAPSAVLALWASPSPESEQVPRVLQALRLPEVVRQLLAPEGSRAPQRPGPPRPPQEPEPLWGQAAPEAARPRALEMQKAVAMLTAVAILMAEAMSMAVVRRMAGLRRLEVQLIFALLMQRLLA